MKLLLTIRRALAASLTLAALTILAASANADHQGGQGKGKDMRPTEIVLTIKDHKFTPDTITVAAGHRFRLVIINEDDTPIEFESDDTSPKLERIIAGGNRGTIVVQGQEPGEYEFFDEFNEDEAKGVLIVVADEDSE